ncbi:tetratricopeptide repeat protein [Streptomyces sp. NPDC047071]|uniref:tetratricopeptide repeat protein n=1 Tax=Streptomyces sp. NPDC047071 TaxID=3154808 RepID=UPI003454EF4C
MGARTGTAYAAARTACAEGEARWARGDGPGAEASFRRAADLARPARADDGSPPGAPPPNGVPDPAPTDAPRTTDAPDASAAPRTTDAPDTADAPGATSAPDTTDPPGSADVTAAPDGADVLVRARIGLGRLRLAAGDAEQALVEFRRAREADPGGAAAPFWTGCALARRGDLAAAEACFTEALDRPDPHPRAAVQRAYVRAKSGRTAAALDDLRAAARTGPLDDEARWVEAALSGGARQAALRLRRAALTALGGDAPDRERAAALAAASWGLCREPGAYVPLYAVTLVAGGRRDAAVGLLDDATRHDPADHRVTHALALGLLNSPSHHDSSTLERCVGAWGALLHDTAFWERVRHGAARRYGVDAPESLVPDLRTALCEHLARRLADRGAETGARVPPDLLLQREAEAARLLDAAVGAAPRPPGAEASPPPRPSPGAAGGPPDVPVRGGPMRIAALGAVREFGVFAAARPDDALVHAFSELGFAHMQLRLGLPGDALAALGELRCHACRARARATDPGAAPVCEADCPRFDELNPGYAGLADRHERLARDARDLALHARVTLGHDQLRAEPPDFGAATASLRRALVHARELGRYRPTQAKVVGLALAAAKDAHRAGLLGRAVATLEAARTVIGANERPRIDGQLARALADRGIVEANREGATLDAPAADLRRSVDLSPHGRRAQLSLGIVLRGLALQRWGSGSLSGARAALEEAVEALTAALARFPDDPEIAEERRRAQDELDFVREQFDESGR